MENYGPTPGKKNNKFYSIIKNMVELKMENLN